MLVAPLGLCVGIVLGLTGAGGAVLSVPLLTLVIGLPLIEAAPIGLLAVTVAAGLGAVLALKQGILRYKAAMLMAVAGSMISPLGVWIAHLTPNWLLTAMFSILLLWIGTSTWLQACAPPGAEVATREPPCQLNPKTGKFLWTRRCARAMAVSGVSAGFISGLLGVGGGFIVIPALRRHTDLPMNSIVATSMGVLTLVSAVGVIAFLGHAPLNSAVGTPFIAGAVAGMFLGRYFSARLTGPKLQKSFALLCVSVAVAMSLSLARTMI